MKKEKPKYFISLKQDETILEVRGCADIPAYNRQDSLFVEIRKNKDGVLYAFFDRRNNQTGDSYFLVWILDSVDRVIKALDKALVPRKFYADIKWNTPKPNELSPFDDNVKAMFGGNTFAPKFVSRKWNWQDNYRFDLYRGVWVC